MKKNLWLLVGSVVVQDHPAVETGYKIMADVAGHIGTLARQAGVEVVFTIIPTRELVYAIKVRNEELEVPDDYSTLVTRESENIAVLSERIRSIPDVHYIDVVTPLQEAALGSRNLYAPDKDDRPEAAGYRVIGKAISGEINEMFPERPSGFYSVVVDDQYSILLVNNEGVWYFASHELIEKNDWPPGEVRNIEFRDLVNLPHKGIVNTVDRSRFGPECCISR